MTKEKYIKKKKELLNKIELLDNLHISKNSNYQLGDKVIVKRRNDYYIGTITEIDIQLEEFDFLYFIENISLNFEPLPETEKWWVKDYQLTKLNEELLSSKRVQILDKYRKN